jgi:hypothetical protein
VGGMSNFIAMLMKGFFDPEGVDCRTSGIMLDLREEDYGPAVPFRFLLDHTCTIADYKAIVEVLGSRGVSASLPCTMCRNVVDHRTAIAENSTELVPLTSLEPFKWKLRTDAFVASLFQKLRVAHATMGIGEFQDYQQRLGWTYNANGVLNDSALAYKSMSTLMYDWMHVWVVGGVFERTLDSLLARCAREGIKPAMIHEYLQPWQWPSQLCHGRAVFETGKFGASASEQLTVYPLLAKYFKNVKRVAPCLAKEVDVFIKACAVLDILGLASRGGSTPQELQDATVSFAEAYTESFGEHNWVLKFHLALHLAWMWASQGILPNCFALERYHKVIKKSILDHVNTRSYEKSVMQETCLNKWHSLESARGAGIEEPLVCSTGDRLAVIQKRFPLATEITTGKGFRSETGARYRAKDVVRIGLGAAAEVGEVWWHCNIDGENLTLLNVWPPARCATTRAIKNNPQFRKSEDISAAAIHRRSDDNVFVVWP